MRPHIASTSRGRAQTPQRAAITSLCRSHQRAPTVSKLYVRHHANLSGGLRRQGRSPVDEDASLRLTLWIIHIPLYLRGSGWVSSHSVDSFDLGALYLNGFIDEE